MLVGFWAIGEKPTGSGDPYQLRRAALGVIRIVLENDLRVSLPTLFSWSLGCYCNLLRTHHHSTTDALIDTDPGINEAELSLPEALDRRVDAQVINRLKLLANVYGSECMPEYESGTDDWGGLPAGPGRENIFYICAACHSLAIVLQQRLTRDSWEETLVWMAEEQGMPEPEPEELTIILDYLGSRFSAVTPR